MSPPGRSALVVGHADRKGQRALQRLVGGAPCPVEVVDSAAALEARVGPDAIAIVDAGLARAHPQLAARPARAWIAVPGDGAAPADGGLVEELLAAGWRHVIAHPMPLLAEELLTTVQKLLRADVFGLEKYLAWGAEIRTRALADAHERDAVVADLAREVVGLGLPERVGSLVSVIADELLSNALYVAPVDAAGRRIRAHEPRDRARALAGRDVVVLRWATDARYLAVEVRDRWGSLDPRVAAMRLAAGRQAAAAEGGMGLPLAYACCTQLVLDVAPGALTEVITLLDVRYRPVELGRTASFHSFEAPPSSVP